MFVRALYADFIAGRIAISAPTSDTRFARSPHADATLAGDRAAIYHRQTKSAITLNPAGTVLWEAMKSPRTAEELAAILREKWPSLDTETARRDVDAFLESLRGHDLVEITA